MTASAGPADRDSTDVRRVPSTPHASQPKPEPRPAQRSHHGAPRAQAPVARRHQQRTTACGRSPAAPRSWEGRWLTARSGRRGRGRASPSRSPASSAPTATPRTRSPTTTARFGRSSPPACLPARPAGQRHSGRVERAARGALVPPGGTGRPPDGERAAQARGRLAPRGRAGRSLTAARAVPACRRRNGVSCRRFVPARRPGGRHARSGWWADPVQESVEAIPTGQDIPVPPRPQ